MKIDLLMTPEFESPDLISLLNFRPAYSLTTTVTYGLLAQSTVHSIQLIKTNFQ